ncbi:TPMT family class I SAM-dependent methyltransferase [Robertkochia aurantiaca]|uniref:TPMT family class I SAM-dependent methyltransferase n=1 Tax=Robertkochia aurantiaca TaxID=2873700 RepID=UPI001CCDF329|nr:TPMT family class I SAM-dependent methyltransferase [Robertkochia sp. 3YJGBD-33]
MKNLNASYWENRYQAQDTPWDIGYAATPLVHFIDGLQNKDIKILIPGAGNAHEALYCRESGFRKTYVLDFASRPLENLKEKAPDFPGEQLIQKDFFELEDQFDLILEQTFFCAIDPGKRSAYAEKMASLLTPGGCLAGLFFEFPLTETGPPFGGHRTEYEQYFKPYFTIKKMERCYNSIAPRMGKELFFIFEKKQA